MTFTRAKPLGWVDDIDSIVQAQINQIDLNQSRSLDGNAGGRYTPSPELEIDGDGIRTDTLNVDGALTVETGGAVQVDTGATFNVDPNATFEGELRVDQLISMADGAGGPTALLAPEIRHKNYTTTGDSDFPVLMVRGQLGRNQTGSNDNNPGGRVVVAPGASGSLGSGFVGGDGSFQIQAHQGAIFAEHGLHFFTRTYAISASGSATMEIPKFILEDNSMAFVEVEMTARTASVANLAFSRKGQVVMVDGVSVMSLPGGAIGDIAVTVGFGSPPTITLSANADDQLEILIDENDAVDIKVLLVVKVSAVGPF